MNRKIGMGVGAALAVAISAGALAQDANAEIVAKMNEYLTLWNAHDAAGVIANVYRMAPGSRMGTVEGLKAEFERLKTQENYQRSVSHGIRACTTGPDTGLGEMRYTRLKTDGSFIPPEMRTTVYQLRRFPDGWRITSIGAGADNCFAPAAQPKAGG